MSFFDGGHGRVAFREWPAHQPQAGLIFLTELGEPLHDYDELAQELNHRQISLWVTDATGAGLDRPVRSLDPLVDGVHRLTELLELLSAELPVAIAGDSLGGTVAALAAARRSGYLGLILAAAPVSRLSWADWRAPDHPVSLHGEQPVREPAYTVGAVDSAWAELAVVFPDQRSPVLFVHGTNDQVVPITDNQRWARRLRSAEMVPIGRARHDVMVTTSAWRCATTFADFIHAVAFARTAA
jgi:alpha-beta hydrolase superfamily lysophospholipase